MAEILYEKKIIRIKETFEHREPDSIPIISFIQTYALSYTGVTAKEVLNDVDKELNAYAQYLKDIYFDGTNLFGINRPVKAYNALGGEIFFFANDGVTLQHRDNSLLPIEEIDEYIEDPFAYLRNKVFYRRYPNLRKLEPENLQVLLTSFQEFAAFWEKTKKIPEFLRIECDTPIITGGLSEPALDRYICYRGFADGMTDLRRRPEKALEAINASFQVVAPQKGVTMEDFPYVFLPVVTATYLNRKSFKKFFLPTMKQALDIFLEAGAKVMFCFEGNWEHLYDLFLDYPKGFLGAAIESSDMLKAKKDIGDKIAIVGGLKLETLKYGPKQACIDEAKRVIDGCAPGGGFMLGMDKGVMSPKDIDSDNLRAVNEFAREYGKY